MESAGVLSSEKKKVVEAEAVQELGAMFDSEARLLGASAERLVKLIQSTGKRRSPESGCRLCAEGGCMSYNSGGQVWLLFIRFGDGLGEETFCEACWCCTARTSYAMRGGTPSSYVLGC